MRSFVLFLFSCYLIAVMYIVRIVIVYVQAVIWGKTSSPLHLWQILLIAFCMLATLPLFYLMVRDGTNFAQKWLAFFLCIASAMTSVVTLCYPVKQFPQGVFLGVIGIFAILWLVVGL